MPVERVVNAVYKPVIQKYPKKTVCFKTGMQAIRACLSPQESKRLLYIAGDMRPQAEGVLQAFAEEILDRMNPGFIFIVKQNIMKPIRRPEILAGYSYMGRVYIALSERVLITGKNNVIAKAEVASFTNLPRPNKAADFDKTCRKWSCDLHIVREYMNKNFMQTPHIPQKDVFQDDEFNFLFYKANNRFSVASPRALEVGGVSVRKKVASKDDDDEFPM